MIKEGDYVKVDWEDLSFDVEVCIYKVIVPYTPFGVLLLNVTNDIQTCIYEHLLYKDSETIAINRKEKIERILQKIR